MKIGVFDSGKGGFTVLSAIKESLPDAEYLYIADSKNCPYGEKNDQELREAISGVVECLIDWGADIIVIACNTATTRCIEYLREKYPNTPFVGIEPAIGTAIESGAKNILVMATPGTIESERTHELFSRKQAKNQGIKLLACPGLADAIEFDRDIDGKLDELIGELPKDYEVVVLGCTHYSLIKDRIQKYFPEASLLDGNRSVVKRVLELVKQM